MLDYERLYLVMIDTEHQSKLIKDDLLGLFKDVFVGGTEFFACHFKSVLASREDSDQPDYIRTIAAVDYSPEDLRATATVGDPLTT